MEEGLSLLFGALKHYKLNPNSLFIESELSGMYLSENEGLRCIDN